jgi:hypothetical protein
MLGEHPLAMRVVGGQVDEVEDDQATRETERGLDRVGQPAAPGRLHGEAVDDDFDRVLLLLLQRRRLGERDDLAVDPGAAVALGLQLAEELGVLALAPAHHGGEDLEADALGHLEDPVDDLLRRLRAIGLPHLGQCGRPARA